MGSFFGGGGSSTPTYIPVAQPVQAAAPESVDADKSISDSKNKFKRQLAMKASSANNVHTSPLGDSSGVSVQNKVLLGQ